MRVLLVQNTWPEATERVVRDMGYDVACVNYRLEPPFVFERDASGDFPEIERPMDRGRRRWQPEVVVLQQGDRRDGTCLDADWATAMRERGAYVVWWTYDPPAKRDLYAEIALACDEIVVCCEQDRAFFRKRHPRVRVDYLGIEPEFWRPVRLTREEQECYGDDVLLAGHLYPSRLEAIRFLREEGIHVETWGGPGHMELDQERIRYAYMASRINLVIPYVHEGQPDPWYLFSRCFEIPACGGYMIAQHNKAFDEFLPEVPTFTTAAEMIDLIRNGPDEDERERIVEATRDRVLQRFTLRRFFARILQGAEGARSEN